MEIEERKEREWGRISHFNIHRLLKPASNRCIEQFRFGWTPKFTFDGVLRCLSVESFRAFHNEPLVAISGVVSKAFFVLLDEPGVVHGAKLSDGISSALSDAS
jgi:hypothetical protein